MNMEDVMLLLVIIAFFVFCYFVVVLLGRFTDEASKHTVPPSTEEKKARIVLMGWKSPLDTETELERFRSKHGQSDADACCSDDSDLCYHYTRQEDSAKIDLTVAAGTRL